DVHKRLAVPRGAGRRDRQQGAATIAFDGQDRMEQATDRTTGIAQTFADGVDDEWPVAHQGLYDRARGVPPAAAQIGVEHGDARPVRGAFTDKTNRRERKAHQLRALALSEPVGTRLVEELADEGFDDGALTRRELAPHARENLAQPRRVRGQRFR